MNHFRNTTGDPDPSRSGGGRKAHRSESTNRTKEAVTTIRVVSASDLGTNPSNPFCSLTKEERYRRFVQLLAEIHGHRSPVKHEDAA